MFHVSIDLIHGVFDVTDLLNMKLLTHATLPQITSTRIF